MPSVKARHSADDRKGAAQSSPFRFKAQETRYIGALEMVVKRNQEITSLESLLNRTSDPKEQRRLTTRLLATRNNLKSWQDYIDQHCPREPRAVITPKAA